ncbi:TonB-dependent receptor, partial [Escherichia coli]|nr:TonB-dependent receptor [Escherichia coli]
KGEGTDFFSISPYYKRINHVLFSTGTTNAGGDLNVWGGSSPIKVNGVETSTLDTSGKGDVYGIELVGRYSFRNLPGLFDGLGVGGNLTLQRAEAKVFVNGQWRGQRMPQAPRIMYNVELF